MLLGERIERLREAAEGNQHDDFLAGGGM